jgi:hypothetical protein
MKVQKTDDAHQLAEVTDSETLDSVKSKIPAISDIGYVPSHALLDTNFFQN